MNSRMRVECLEGNLCLFLKKGTIQFDRSSTYLGRCKNLCSIRKKKFPLWNVDMLDDMEVNTKVNKVVNHLLLTYL